jgi:hypothetical protein
MPDDMTGLISQYEYGLKYRVYEIVNWLVAEGMLNDSDLAKFIHPVGDVDIMAPIQYPSKLMNAAVNFYTHACEGCTEEELAAQTKERQEKRGVPYLFLKPNRGGRPPGGSRFDSDWFVGKGHDTFAPHGPWIVPKEFYGDPMERLHQTLVIDGVTVQEAKAGDMIHNIPELIEYASSLVTLYPGDVLQSGTSGGTGAGRVERASGSGYLIDGETITANIEGIGSLTHTVRQEASVPDDLSGSQLPPVSSYRPN